VPRFVSSKPFSRVGGIACGTWLSGAEESLLMQSPFCSRRGAFLFHVSLNSSLRSTICPNFACCLDSRHNRQSRTQSCTPEAPATCVYQVHGGFLRYESFCWALVLQVERVPWANFLARSDCVFFKCELRGVCCF